MVMTPPLHNCFQTYLSKDWKVHDLDIKRIVVIAYQASNSTTQEIALKIQLNIPHNFTPGIVVLNYRNAWTSTTLQIISYAYREAYASSAMNNEFEFLDRVGLYLNQIFVVNGTGRIIHVPPKQHQFHRNSWRKGELKQNHKYYTVSFNKGDHHHCVLCGNIFDSEVSVWIGLI